ncbi:hypothetical protein FRC12_021200, partial [Ceratobasidium sp. 428]
MDFLASLSKSPSRAKSPAPVPPPSTAKPSRFRRQPPPELHLDEQPPKLTASASSSNLLTSVTAVTSAASASTSNLRAPSPSPERDKDPKRDKGKRLGMLAQPLNFHLPRAKSPKPEQPKPFASRFSKSSSTPSIPDLSPTPRSANHVEQPQTPGDSHLIPVTPSTASISSASTSTTNLAPSVPARSPLRGTPPLLGASRSIASFASLHPSSPPPMSEPTSTIGLGLGLAASVVGTSAGWSQLTPPPPISPSVYSPVRSIFHPSERRASAEEHR